MTFSDRAKRPSLIPLFLIALVAVGFEVALTRYFAIASWAEYGYWVISIAMVGVCSSGVVLALAPEWFKRNAVGLLSAIPVGLLLALALGFWWTTNVQFNPLELQNHALMTTQLARIGEYYLALFPFFFLSGLFIGLYFVAFDDIIPKIYAADLVGAGCGGILVLGLMAVLHPFQLPLALLPLIVASGLFFEKLRRRYWWALGLAAICAAGILLTQVKADYNEYKSISPPLKVEGSKIIEEARSSRGVYAVLDNFTERLDIDLSNNEQVLGGAQPIATYGLYNDGNRVTSLAKAKPGELAYLNASLDIFPYRIRPNASALLIGTRGGFRLDEVKALGVKTIHGIEPDPVLQRFVLQYRSDIKPSEITNTAPQVFFSQAAAKLDVIDIASDFLSQSEANKYLFTTDGFAQALGALQPNGILSVPMSIREFTVYALKATLTARDALLARGVKEPNQHIIVYRSAWNARVLVSPSPFTAQDIAALKLFAEERSFDASYFPGVNLAAQKVWNDLPSTSFDEESAARSEEASDALAKEINAALFKNELPSRAFNLSPATADRPFFNSVLRLTEIKPIFDRIQMVPREELGVLINVAVLIQACLLAALVLTLPLFKRATLGAKPATALKAMGYFAGLGLGYLMIQIYLIEKSTALLNDRALAFALVLGTMLIASGVGSFLSARWERDTFCGVRLAWVVIVVWAIFAYFALDIVLASAVALPLWVKCVIVIFMVATISVALGFPFSLGLVSLKDTPGFVPWAWSLNGAFSVVATPLANLLALSVGLSTLVILGGMLYTLCLVCLPRISNSARI
jgi:hypothetical protein